MLSIVPHICEFSSSCTAAEQTLAFHKNRLRESTTLAKRVMGYLKEAWYSMLMINNSISSFDAVFFSPGFPLLEIYSDSESDTSALIQKSFAKSWIICWEKSFPER